MHHNLRAELRSEQAECERMQDQLDQWAVQHWAVLFLLFFITSWSQGEICNELQLRARALTVFLRGKLTGKPLENAELSGTCPIRRFHTVAASSRNC